MAPNDRAPVHDDRWGDHIPWSIRYSSFSKQGDFPKFIINLATRLHTLLEHEGDHLSNRAHFFARLKTESFGQFRPKNNDTYANGIYHYFSPETISTEAQELTTSDPEYKEYQRLFDLGDHEAYKKALVIERATYPERYADHWRNLIGERLEVLQSILILLQQDKKHDLLKSLMRDIRRIAANAGVWLNIIGAPPALVPLEEPLLQKEILDRLLPRLEARFPARAIDLINAYNDLLKGVDTNTVFGHAFKTLEELAREISGTPKLGLNDPDAIRKSFPQLHGTIQATITKLAAHRGDEGAHGRKGPDEYEIRYLLFSICNVALLLLDYKEHWG